MMRMLIPLLLAFGLGCSASDRQTAITASFATTQAAAASFLAYDARHEQDLANAAPDKVTAKAELAAWRAKRRDIDKLVVAAFQTIAAAAIANDDASVAGMVRAGGELATALKSIGVAP